MKIKKDCKKSEFFVKNVADHNDDYYNVLKFDVENQKLRSKVQQWKYDSERLVLGKVKILGVDFIVHEVTVSGKVVSFEYDPSYEVSLLLLL